MGFPLQDPEFRDCSRPRPSWVPLALCYLCLYMGGSMYGAEIALLLLSQVQIG